MSKMLAFFREIDWVKPLLLSIAVVFKIPTTFGRQQVGYVAGPMGVRVGGSHRLPEAAAAACNLAAGGQHNREPY